MRALAGTLLVRRSTKLSVIIGIARYNQVREINLMAIGQVIWLYVYMRARPIRRNLWRRNYLHSYYRSEA